MPYERIKGSGVWSTCIRLKSTGKVHREVCPSYKHAEALEAKLKKDDFEGRRFDMYKQKKISFKDFAAKYEKNHAGFLSQWEESGKYILNQLVGFWGNKDLTEIKSFDILQMKNNAIKEGLSPATINRRVAMVKTMYAKAQEWGDFFEINHPDQSKSTLAPAKNWKNLQENPRTRIGSIDELKRILHECSELTREAVIIGLLTLMRKGEIQRLTDKEDSKMSVVDFNRDTIIIRKQKNKKISEIPMHPVVRHILSNRFKKLSVPYDFDWKKSFNEACINAGIKDFQFRDLRRTGAVELRDSCKDVATVQAMLRHSNIKMTMVYAIGKNHTLETAINKNTFFGDTPFVTHEQIGMDEKVAVSC